MMQVKLSAIQLSSKPNVEKNLETIREQLAKLTNKHSVENIIHFVVLPECCLYFGGKDSEQLTLAQTTSVNDQLRKVLSSLAKNFKVYLIAGTIPLLAHSGNKFTNTSCLFSPNGEILGQYDKIHLFDVKVEDNEKSYCESKYTQAGNSTILVETAELNMGLSVCFDVRFPLLYQQLSKLGADVIAIPSAFTKVTGKAHWQTLLQARAIENQVYIIAAAQFGIHENGRETWGHSMIISPWGEILNCLDEGEGCISVNYDAEMLHQIRLSMPINN